jgi:hypothetical protein
MLPARRASRASEDLASASDWCAAEYFSSEPHPTSREFEPVFKRIFVGSLTQKALFWKILLYLSVSSVMLVIWIILVLLVIEIIRFGWNEWASSAYLVELVRW